MFLSVFDVFKIGIGPSSSHTMGPMTAAVRFLDLLRQADAAQGAARLKVVLHGSLAFTGKGHATDRAVALGLLGYLPADLDPDAAEGHLAELHKDKMLRPSGLPELDFDPATDIVFDYGPALPGHANGLIFQAFDAQEKLLPSETFYSIGGGFVVTAAEREAPVAAVYGETAAWPFPFDNAAAMLRMARESGLSIAAMKRANETSSRPAAEVEAGIERIWGEMDGCIERGLAQDGELPGAPSRKEDP